MNTEKLWFVVNNETNVFYKVEETISDNIFKLTSQETNKSKFMHELEFKNKIDKQIHTLFDVYPKGTYIGHTSDLDNTTDYTENIFYEVKCFKFVNNSLVYTLELKGVPGTITIELTHDDVKDYRELKDSEIPLNIL